MKYSAFGRKTGLRVPQLALGTGMFGTAWGHGSEKEEAQKTFDTYVRAGGNFIDTANRYQYGQSEEMVGEFIASNRDYFTVATKFTMGSGKDELTTTGNSRKSMVRAVEESLRRLKTNRIDLYWVHIPDGLTPMDEILRGLDDLVRSGMILYGGLSNFPAWRVSRGDTLAELKNLSPIAGIQIEYSLVERTAERELLPMAEALGIAVTAWSPLAGGLLTGKYRQSLENEPNRQKGMGGRLFHFEKTERDTAVVDQVVAIAKELEVSATQIAMAWLLEKAALSTTALVPILGPRTPKQLEDSLAALSVKLSADQFERLNTASHFALGVPHEIILASAGSIAGGDADRMHSRITPVA